MKHRRDSIFVRRSCPTRRATSNKNCKHDIEISFDRSNDDLERTTRLIHSMIHHQTYRSLSFGRNVVAQRSGENLTERAMIEFRFDDRR